MAISASHELITSSHEERRKSDYSGSVIGKSADLNDFAPSIHFCVPFTGTSSSKSHKRDQRKYFLSNAPFNIQVPSSLRDPTDETISIGELQHLRTLDDARNVALGCVHDEKIFASLWHSNQIHPETRRWLRKLVQIQTINAVCNGFYRLPDRTRIKLDNDMMVHAARESKLYGNNYQYETGRQKRTHAQPAKILVVNGDCLDTVRYFKEKHGTSNPVVLNMANAHSPGGGWRNGSGAQEENLHRRTNLFQCLEDSYCQLAEKRDWHYPIPEFGGIYSPDVSVFRGSESQGYPFFSHGPEYISFIACAAYAHPLTKISENGEIQLRDKNVILNTKRKIDTILKIALDNEHDTIILSAFGCGAFKNPPKHIATLFNEVISQNYCHSFKYILFAIIEDHNAMQKHNLNGNIQPFADIFAAPILSINEL